jgi:hypothetical protein
MESLGADDEFLLNVPGRALVDHLRQIDRAGNHATMAQTGAVMTGLRKIASEEAHAR